jgi:hypothetical protein
MPIPGTKLAPEKFRGDFHKVKEFIQHYERLCAQNNVTLDTEKCEMLLRYCSRREKQTIKNISGFAGKSWDSLRENILRLYDADLDTRRYKLRDVRNFSKRQKERKIKDLAGWKKYCRAFLRVAGSLLSEGRIGETEYATYFWQGIPRTLRTRIENRILARDPIRDLSDPFGVDEVDAAAAAILQRDRFDRALEDSDSEDEDSSDEESSSDSDDESSESESEDEKEKRRRRARKRTRTRMRNRELRKQSSKDENIAPAKKRLVNESHKEVENLIKQMNLLTRDDPQYGIDYYRALKLDPDISRIVAEPSLRRGGDLQYTPRNAAAYHQTAAPQPTGPPNPQPNLYRPPPFATPPRGSEMTCYGCGEKGHGMSRCPTIGELVNKGMLVKDIAGRIIYPDGSAIRRLPNETYAQAYEREQRPKSHLITIANDQADDQDSTDDEGVWIGNNQSDDSDWLEDTDREDVFAVQDVHWDSYAVDRPEKSIAAKK